MNRPQLIAMMDYVREDDHVHVHELSRLGRSVVDLHNIVDQLLEKEVGITFTKEKMTFAPGKDADPLQDLMFGMLANFSQFERSLLKQRQAEGIAAAKAKGKHLGRHAILNNQQKMEIVKKKASGSTPTALAKEYGVSRATVYNVIKGNK